MKNTSQQKIRWSLYPWIGLFAGIGILGALYLQASQTQVPYLFERFWLGMFLFYIPAFYRQLSSNVSRNERVALLIGSALFCYIPKLLRCPNYFCFSDELTWWRGVQNLLSGAPVLSNNILGLVQGLFPGLPLFTILIEKAIGLTTFQTGLVIMGLLRLITLVSFFLLGEFIFHSGKIGAVSALIFSMNPNFFFFDSNFSYESLAVPLLLMTLVIIQFLIQRTKGREGIAWSCVILLNIAAIVITHHVATYMMILIFSIMTLAIKILPRFTSFKTSQQIDSITLFSLVSGLSWLIFVAVNVVKYLEEPIAMGINQMASFQTRPLFGGITLPEYEVISGYLAVILIIILALIGSYLIIQQFPKLYAAQVGLLAFGSLYLVTAPIVLTSWGAEAGRRSWTYSFVGLALISGFALTWLTRSFRFGKIFSILSLAILLVGGIAESTSISYRFPGSFLLNSDARSFTPEIIGASQWLLNQVGPNNRILGDRTTERIFGSYGFQEPAMFGGPRPWEVFLPTSWTSSAIYWLEHANAPFIVVDKRMAELAPQMSIRFQGGEPSSEYINKPLPIESVEKFDNNPQLDRIFDSGNIRIYYFNNNNQNKITVENGTSINQSQNVIESITNSDNLDRSLLSLLSIFSRSLFLVILIPIVPGYFIGQKLFTKWSKWGLVIRIMVSTSLSISTIILSSFFLALILSDVEKAISIILFFLGLLLLYILIKSLICFFTHKSIQQNILNNTWYFIKNAWSNNSIIALLFLLTSLLLLVWLMGKIKPNQEPYTDFGINPFVETTTLQIANHENREKDYRIRIYGDNITTWDSQLFHLELNQTLELTLQQLPVLLPSQDEIYIELYIQGQEKPYRSIHFLLTDFSAYRNSVSN